MFVGSLFVFKDKVMNGGAIVYKNKKAQEKIDEALDKKEPDIPKPVVLKDGTRRWTFG